MRDICRIYDLSCKEVINLRDGARLGYINDAEINISTGRVISVIIPGRLKLFGLMGREEDIIIPWDKIEKIGEDIIFVRADCTRPPKHGCFMSKQL